MDAIRKALAAGAVLVAVSFAVGCSRAAMEAGRGAGAGEPAAPEGALDEAGGEAGGVVVVGEGSELPPVGPNVIKTAELRLELKRGGLRESIGRATAIAGRHLGFVVSTSVEGERSRRGTLVIRVPADRFEQALVDLRRLGGVRGEAVSGQDVGQEFVDLEARLRNWEAQEAVLLRLMDRARTVADTIKVQRELQTVQLEIERIRGRLRYLEDQTSMSTITVSMTEAGAPARIQTGAIGRAWRQAADLFLAVVAAVIVGAGAVLPVAIVAAAAWLVFRGVRRGVRPTTPAA